jgi:hypothetical protein
MNKEIVNKNDKGQLHGYQEWYLYKNNKLWYRCNYKNGQRVGYYENHIYDSLWGKKQTYYIIK